MISVNVRYIGSIPANLPVSDNRAGPVECTHYFQAHSEEDIYNTAREWSVSPISLSLIDGPASPLQNASFYILTVRGCYTHLSRVG